MTVFSYYTNNTFIKKHHNSVIYGSYVVDWVSNPPIKKWLRKWEQGSL